MKTWEKTHDKINGYSRDVSGTIEFNFKKSEISSVFLEIHNYIEMLNGRYPKFQLVYDFNWSYTTATLYWRRPLTDEEKLEAKRLRKIENERVKKLQLAYAKKLAKKFRLIK